MKKTLLLADDSPTIQKVINLTFADEGIDVIAVSDGNAAVQRLREMTPDLVMADVHMPGLNGYQICERIRQNGELKKVPVILLVGSFEPFDEEEAKRVGADDFLMKPFQSIRQLVGRVTALLDSNKEESDQPETSEAPETVEADIQDISKAEIPGTFPAPEQITGEQIAGEQISNVSTTGQPSPVSPEINFAETLPDVAAEVAEEDDDLADFDSEFDKKFPDAALLSSEYVDSAHFAPAAVSDDEVSDHKESAELPALPEKDLNRTISLLQTPERISDEETSAGSAEPVEPVAPVMAETSSILDLGDFGGFKDAAGTDGLLHLEDSETGDEKNIAAAAEPAEPVEPVEVAEAAPPALVQSEETAEAPQYNFRDPDAFDEDIDIQESFHGLPKAEETPFVPFQSSRPSQAFEAPLERIVDDPKPGSVSEDQADGFSAINDVPAAAPVSPEAIDAAAQKVLEQISEKVIKEFVRGIMPDIKELIAKEIAKENE